MVVGGCQLLRVVMQQIRSFKAKLNRVVSYMGNDTVRMETSRPKICKGGSRVKQLIYFFICYRLVRYRRAYLSSSSSLLSSRSGNGRRSQK
jgi:hypothetical protein